MNKAIKEAAEKEGIQIVNDTEEGTWIESSGDQLESLYLAAERAGWERCRRDATNKAALFTMKPDRQIHPDIPWDQMNEGAKTAAHTTAQQIAMEISAIPYTEPKE